MHDCRRRVTRYTAEVAGLELEVSGAEGEAPAVTVNGRPTTEAELAALSRACRTAEELVRELKG